MIEVCYLQLLILNATLVEGIAGGKVVETLTTAGDVDCAKDEEGLIDAEGVEAKKEKNGERTRKKKKKKQEKEKGMIYGRETYQFELSSQ